MYYRQIAGATALYAVLALFGALARVPASDVPLEDGLELPDSGPSPEAAFVADARKRLVYRALGRLSDSYREIILLKDIQGLKVEEIATMLDVPAGTVKSRSNRARLELAKVVLDLSPGNRPGLAPQGSAG